MWTPSTVTLPARAAKGARVWVTLIGDTRASEEHRLERLPTDVRVKAEGRVFHAHREVLLAALAPQLALAWDWSSLS